MKKRLHMPALVMSLDFDSLTRFLHCDSSSSFNSLSFSNPSNSFNSASCLLNLNASDAKHYAVSMRISQSIQTFGAAYLTVSGHAVYRGLEYTLLNDSQPLQGNI